MQIDNIENRNCGCDNENMMPYTMTCNCICECNNMNNETREEMIKKIKCYNFAVIELALYLDTHPDDQKALCLYRKYAKELKELKDQYQKIYGPLSIYFPCNKWRWLEEPWSWFILGVNNYLSFLKIIIQCHIIRKKQKSN